MFIISTKCQCGRFNQIAIPNPFPAKIGSEKEVINGWYSMCQCGQQIWLALPEPLSEKEKQEEKTKVHYYFSPHFWARVREDNDPEGKFKVDPTFSLEFPKAVWEASPKEDRPKADPIAILQFPEVAPVESKKEAKPKDNAVSTLSFSQAAPVESAKKEKARAQCSHSPDFRSAIWLGEGYTFTKNQAKAIEFMWDQWEIGNLVISQELVLRTIGSKAKRLRDIFKGNPAWGNMIKPVGKGMVRFAG